MLNIKELNISLYSLLIQHFIDKEPIQKIPVGSFLFQEKEEVENIYLLLNGSISIGRVHVKGKEFILKILSGEEVIIEYELFKQHPSYHFFAKTMSNCDILVIKRTQFEEYALNEPSILAALSNHLSTRYIKSQIKCQDLIMNGKKGGLYSILIRLCNSYGIVTENGILIDLPITHQELANLTFGTREVIQRMLKELREKDVISYEHQRFTVKNLAYLRHEVDCQNCSKQICGLN
ncbi:Crp/Fnr family transcriptional regulator [Niallia sp. Krafla_26]|uniref:Crp/Fnr family transcriptional regulator n=1 Tax=Niallia sp. Krafla_26 TaxID=3064703 RepID=UPI003D179592